MKSDQTSPIVMELTESQEASISGGSTVIKVKGRGSVQNLKITLLGTNKPSVTVIANSSKPGKISVSNSNLNEKTIEKDIRDLEDELDSELEFDDW